MGTQDSTCLVCEASAKLLRSSLDLDSWDCPSCGKYRLQLSAKEDYFSNVRPLKPQHRQRISGWIRDQQKFGDPPTLSADDIEQLKSVRLPTLPERATRLLSAIVEILPDPLEVTSIADHRIWGASFSITYSDVRLLAEILRDSGFLNFIGDSDLVRITPQGHIEVEEKTLRNPSSSQGFVAMWFSDKVQSAYKNGISPAITAARYSPLRIDTKEHTNKIDDEIVAEIRRSRFLVADFTGHRGGVYFEAGFAMGLNIPVFFTCRHDAIEDLHFDIRQYNTIAWTDEADLKTRLKNRIIAVIGEGPKARN